MAVGLGRFLTTLGVLAFAVMFGSRSMALGGVFVVFRGLVVGVSRHASLLCSSCNGNERLEGGYRS